MTETIGARDLRKWAHEEFASAVREKAAALLEDLDNRGLEERLEIQKQKVRMLKFLRQYEPQKDGGRLP